MAQWEETLSTNDINPDARLDNLKNDNPVPYPGYALCLPRYAKLNGVFSNVSKVDSGNIGYMSNLLSDSSGNFAVYPKITVEFARKKTSNGFTIIFNQVSGDYCNSLHIDWYKYDALVSSQDYTPNSANYFCKASVGLFNRAVVTFKSTNKPYRYLWISELQNTKLTQAEGIKIIYHDVAYQGKEHTSAIVSDDARSDSQTSLLLAEDAIKHPYYSMCLPRYAKLDGDYINTPSTYQNMGFISSQISDGSGIFADPPQLEFDLSQKISSVGIEMYFNTASHDYCNKVNIQWYLDGTKVADVDFIPDDYIYFCEHVVSLYDKIIITFKATNKPYRNAFLNGFDYGIKRQYLKDEVTKCAALAEISPTSESLPIGTLDFSVKNLKNIQVSFEKSQKIYLYFDEQIVGMYYLKSGSRSSDMDYKFKAENFISILDSNSHPGGFYNGAAFSDVVNEIFQGEDVTVYIDDSLNGAKVYGYLPYASKRNNLAQICFAVGAIVDTSFETRINIYKYNPQLDPLVIDDGMVYRSKTSINTGDVITGVEVTAHSYSAVDTSEQLYKGTLNGETTIVFNEPHHDLSITGGTITSSAVNYAVITGSGSEVILTGKKYNHIKQTVKMENSYVYRNKKILKVDKATAVTPDNASDVLSRIYSYYSSNQTLKSGIVLNDIELSDIVTMNTFDGKKTGIIKTLSMEFYGEVKASIEAKVI